MKILPPLSDMISLKRRGAELSTTSLKRWPVAVASLVICSGALVWVAVGAGVAPPSSETIVKAPASSCSALLMERATAKTELRPCPKLTDISKASITGPSIKADSPLRRGAMPERPNQLTAADRAIRPPTHPELRSTVWSPVVTKKDSYQPKLPPVFAQTPILQEQ